MSKAKINVKKSGEYAETLKAMSHPVRISILMALNEQPDLSVTQIHKKVEVEQAVASHHLAILKSKELITSKRNGQNIYYSLGKIKVGQIINALDKI